MTNTGTGALFLLALSVALLAPGTSFTSEEAGLLFPNSDFEQGDLTNWRTEGLAFINQPVKGENALVRESGKDARPQGEYWIGTYERYQGRPGQRPGTRQGDAPVGGLLSVPFIIEKPHIAFLVGGGRGNDLGVRLVVEGEVVRTSTGVGEELMREEVWDVAEYVGERAMVYVMDHATGGWGHVNADYFHYVEREPERLLFPNSDFEEGTLGNWTAEGGAFEAQPTKGDNVAARTGNRWTARVQGTYWVGTYERYTGAAEAKPGGERGDGPTGTLRSIPFTVNSSVIAFRIGGGKQTSVGVRLLVNEQTVETAHGTGVEDMLPVVWDVQAYLGQQAELEVYDRSDGPWGHINVDNFHYAREK